MTYLTMMGGDDDDFDGEYRYGWFVVFLTLNKMNTLCNFCICIFFFIECVQSLNCDVCTGRRMCVRCIF
jgi:hypothetical protein